MPKQALFRLCLVSFAVSLTEPLESSNRNGFGLRHCSHGIAAADSEKQRLVASQAIASRRSILRLNGGSDRDFKTVIFNKKPAPKPSSNSSFVGKQTRADDEIGPIPTVPHELRVAIMKARQAKNMTQKDLAKQLNELVQTIQWYESGREVPTNALIAKMERILGTKLPRIKPQKAQPKAEA